jgi:hypothetical protein
MADPPLAAAARLLAARQLADWAGLPARLRATDAAESAGAVTLGSDRVDAELLHLDDPADGAWARAWRRDGYVVLVQVSWRAKPVLGQLRALGAPDEVADAADGLITLEAGEWLFPRRGLTALVSPEGGHIRHLFGYVPTTAGTYRRELRPDLSERRRPTRSSPGSGGAR